MSSSIIEAYIKFYKKSILTYNRLLLKYLDIEDNLLENVSIEKIDKIVCECCKRKYSNNINPEVIDIDLEIMLSSQKKGHQDLNLILSVLNQQIISLKKLENNDDLIRLYRILSNSILIAIELNERTCSIVNRNCSFKEVILMIQKKYGKYLEPDVVKKITGSIPLVRDEYNKRTKIIDKLILHYEKSKIDFEGFKLNNISNQDNWFQISPKYNFEKLKLTGKRKISTIVSRQSSFKDIIFILLDMVNYEILKKYITRKSVSNYIVYLPNDFLKTKTNTFNLVKLLENSYSKEHIYLEIEYSQLRKYTEHFKILKENNISVIVSNINRQYSKEVVELIDFICLDKNDFLDEKLMKIVKDNKINIIFEQESDQDYPQEVRLIRNSSNYKMISREKMV